MAPSPANSHGNGYPLGLAGAVLATRFVGGTATVAPTTGTFQVGDFVIGRNGTLFVCTVAGTPGTWVQVGAGGSGTVTSVTAADGSIVVGGTAADPTIATGTLDAIAAAHAPAANWSNNSKKITAVTAGAASGEAAVYQQTPASLLTTTGDLLYASAANTPARLAIGATGQVPAVAAGVPAFAYPPGYQFDRAAITSDGTTTQTVEASATTLITGGSVTYDGSTVVRIVVTAPDWTNNTGGTATVVNLYRDSTDLGRVALTTTPSALSIGSVLYGELQDTPSAGAHTYSLRAWVTAASTGTVRAGAGGAGARVPAVQRIVRV